MYDANDMLTFIRKAIQTRSFSDEEGEMAEFALKKARGEL